MQRIIGLFAVSDDLAFGDKGGMPWKNSDDLKRFKEVTMGKTLIVGTKTYTSLPELAGRDIVVVGNGYHDIEGALKTCFERGLEEVYVIGGAGLLESMKHYLTHLDITVINGEYPDADTRAPDFGNIQWKKISGPTPVGENAQNILLEKIERI